MIIFNFKTKTTTLSAESSKQVYSLIFVDNKLHKICCPYFDSRGHFVYNNHSTNQFTKITSFKSVGNSLLHCSVIYLHSRKLILMFGGKETKNNTFQITNSIYQFSCPDSKWTKAQIEMPQKLEHFGLVATKNEQYIIILGGRTNFGVSSYYPYSNNIFIYDIRNNIFTKSKVKCPKKAKYHAIILNNSKRDELTCFGFVNKCYKKEQFEGVQLLPQYLIKFISCYFCHEEIYLLARATGHHWKINIDFILQ